MRWINCSIWGDHPTEQNHIPPLNLNISLKCSSCALMLLSLGCAGELESKPLVQRPAPTQDMAPSDLNTPDLFASPDMKGTAPDMIDTPDMRVERDMEVVDMEPASYQGTRTGQFTRRSCESGCAGALVRYSSTQRSQISTADAERLAQMDVLANGQAHADATGSCDCAPPVCGCEDLRNHGPAGPHLYYDVPRGVLTGDVIASCAPLFWVEGLTQSYERMSYIGAIPNSDKKVYRYTVPADTAGRNVHLKSAGDGCQDYPDVRLQPLDTRVRDAWVELPQLPAVTPSVEDIPFFFSSHLEQSEQDAFIWGIYTIKPWENLQYSVNGGGWTPFKAPEQWGWFNASAPFSYVSTETIKPPKDFILDITRDAGATTQRFTVFRTSKGGHYTSMTTATRQDGRVWFTAQLSHPESPQYLVHEVTGQRYPSMAPYHYLFDLGILSEGDHRFSLWSAEEVFIDDQVIVKVKRTP